MRISAGVHASIAARTILQIENEQALRFHQSLREELVDGNAVHYLQALLIGGAALASDGFQSCAYAGKSCDHLAEIVAGNAHQFDVIESRACSRSNATAQQTNFAEIVAAGKVGQHHLAARIILRDLHEADANKIKTIGSLGLLNDNLPRRESLQLDTFLQMLDKLGRQIRKHRHPAKMIFKRAAPVSFVKLRSKSLILQHDVEHVAEHFVGDYVGLRDNRGRPRIEIHARHFAKEVAWAEFGDGVAVRKIH